MKNSNTFSGGYVAIILLIIGILVIFFITVSRYSGLGPNSSIPGANGVDIATSTVGKGPIDRAQNVRNLVETRSATDLEQ